VNAPAQTSRGDGEVGVFFGCHSVICAVDTRWVIRLLLDDQVSFVEASKAGATGADSSAQRQLDGRHVVEADRQRFAAWDLGEMLGMPALHAAWLLMGVPHGGVHLPLALRIGPCLLVGRIPASRSLPIGIFRQRAHALAACFATEGMGPRAAFSVAGLLLDPAALFTSDELERSRRTLDRSPIDVGGKSA
jgi:hypothetical protein